MEGLAKAAMRTSIRKIARMSNSFLLLHIFQLRNVFFVVYIYFSLFFHLIGCPGVQKGEREMAKEEEDKFQPSLHENNFSEG